MKLFELKILCMEDGTVLKVTSQVVIKDYKITKEELNA